MLFLFLISSFYPTMKKEEKVERFISSKKNTSSMCKEYKINFRAAKEFCLKKWKKIFQVFFKNEKRSE